MEFFKQSDADNPWAKSKGWITIHKANRLLRERGKVVYGRVDGNRGWFDNPNDHGSLVTVFSHGGQDKPPEAIESTNLALLVCVEPIEKPDSAEKLLEDLIKRVSCNHGELSELVNRAKKLLEDRKLKLNE